jgi:hypothetical protein
MLEREKGILHNARINCNTRRIGSLRLVAGLVFGNRGGSIQPGGEAFENLYLFFMRLSSVFALS